jgi:CRISP-associated protein Cas1
MTTSPLGRIVEIAEGGRFLAKSRGFLTIATGGEEVGRVPLDDIGAVIATSSATTASCALLAELAVRGIPFVLCGRNFAPVALIWPVAGHHAQQRRIEAQANTSKPLAKRLWSRIVAVKIRRQGWALRSAGQPSGAFDHMAGRVRSGDPENLEAQAARRYWSLMMGKEFRRDINGEGINALLNYGYAVLRGATARAIIAAGLHPGLGIFHRHPQNATPLADDLMEPFRPLVDVTVRTLAARGAIGVTTEAKRALAAILLAEEDTTAGRTPVSTCMIRLAASLADSYLTGEPALEFPIHWIPRRTGCGGEED